MMIFARSETEATAVSHDFKYLFIVLWSGVFADEEPIAWSYSWERSSLLCSYFLTFTNRVRAKDL